MADMVMQLARYSAALVFLSLHETGSQGAYFVAATLQVRCELIFDFLGTLDLCDVVNRSNQMGTSACVVKNGRDAGFAGQPPGRVIRCFYPAHQGFFFDRLSVFSQSPR